MVSFACDAKLKLYMYPYLFVYSISFTFIALQTYIKLEVYCIACFCPAFVSTQDFACQKRMSV